MRNKYRGKDLEDRLGGTIIRYKEIPYRCRIAGEILVLSSLVENVNVVNVEPDDERLDISSIQLGYVNSTQYKQCAYLKRLPLRRYKQGITHDAVSFRVLKSPVEEQLATRSADYIYSPDFLDMCSNTYPDYETAKVMLTKADARKKIYKSVALSKEIALLKVNDQIQIFIKEDAVGWVNLKTQEVTTVKQEYAWLYRSMLDRVGITINNEGL